jgi:hypothetical protein
MVRPGSSFKACWMLGASTVHSEESRAEFSQNVMTRGPSGWLAAFTPKVLISACRFLHPGLAKQPGVHGPI